jgi:hypothetical protein
VNTIHELEQRTPPDAASHAKMKRALACSHAHARVVELRREICLFVETWDESNTDETMAFHVTNPGKSW